MNEKLKDAQVRYMNSIEHLNVWTRIVEKDRLEYERLLKTENENEI